MQDTTSGQAARWRAALHASAFRWPALVSLAALIVIGREFVADGDDNLGIGNVSIMLSSALCIFGALLAASLPPWIVAARRRLRGAPLPGAGRQLGLACAVLLLALVASPRFGVEYRVYEPNGATAARDVTTTWIKRSLAESLRMPFLRLDELTWLQSNFSAAYIPARVYCPLRSTRLVPMLGVVRFDYEANALAGDEAPAPAVLADTIARCDREGPAMLAAGLSKESALMKGDVARFFALNALETRPHSHSSNTEIVLEDAAIPDDLMARIEAVLAAQASADDAQLTAEQAAGQSDPGYLTDVHYDSEPGRVRRLRPLVLAVALGRQDDIARLRKGD